MIATRVSADLKKRLDTVSALSGRSQAQEVEMRLERSFERDADEHNLLRGVLRSVYSEEDIVGLLITLGLVMSDTRSIMRWAAEERGVDDPKNWARDQSIAVALQVLGGLSPIKLPPTDPNAKNAARSMLRALADAETKPGMFALPAAGLKTMLGDLVSNIEED